MAQLLSNLPIGARVKFGRYSVNGETAQDITWLIVAKSHSCIPAYPSNSVTLLTEKIIDLRCLDACEPQNPINGRNTQGNNRYSLSNIDQWLNTSAEGGKWYVSRHSTDAPPNSTNAPGQTHYVDRPGFLAAFTDDEKNSILDTTIRTRLHQIDGTGGDDTPRKVFLPSAKEVGVDDGRYLAEGDTWVFFSTGSRITPLTSQAYTYSLSTSKSSLGAGVWKWWLRTPETSTPSKNMIIDDLGYSTIEHSYVGWVGVRPAVNLTASLLVSDETDGDGCYLVKYNDAPFSPSPLIPPTAIYGGKSNTISWGISVDPEGDIVTYQLECSIDGGEYTQIYNGTSAAYAHLVPFGTSNVSYRVKATDPSGESSAYTTTDTINVINNNAPVISGVDANLGVKSDDFTGTYTITDANSDVVTVTEAIDGVRIRSLVVPLGEEITYGVTESTWLALPNGSHTLTISATDGIDTSVRTIVFTKLVDKFTIQNSTPWQSSTMPTRIMLVVTRNIPSTSTFKVEVCNNGFDASPTWEDATDAVKSGLVHVMTNKTKTATDWGVLVRVTVERNGATGACYVSAIGGNFE